MGMIKNVTKRSAEALVDIEKANEIISQYTYNTPGMSTKDFNKLYEALRCLAYAEKEIVEILYQDNGLD